MLKYKKNRKKLLSNKANSQIPYSYNFRMTSRVLFQVINKKLLHDIDCNYLMMFIFALLIILNFVFSEMLC